MAERDLEQWKRDIAQDYRLIQYHVGEALRPSTENPELYWAVALKEARRLESDLYRMAEVAGVTREVIDAVGPL